MVNSKNMVIAALLVAGAVIAFMLFFQTDEAKIKKKFNALAKKIDKPADESDLMAAAAANRIEKMFGKSIRIEIPSYSVDKTFPRNEISPHVLYARSQYIEMKIKFHDFQFQFPKEDTAQVNLTAVFKATTISDEPVDEVHEVECILEKIDDEWLFTGIKGVDVLER
jgi:ABC-type multidrug transport system fused ATPase/permease subunit